MKSSSPILLLISLKTKAMVCGLPMISGEEMLLCLSAVLWCNLRLRTFFQFLYSTAEPSEK
jgi:hypothetical protein